MMGEWMRVMLEEIARKKAEAEQARAEERQRAEEKRRAEDRQYVGGQHHAAELARRAEQGTPAAGPGRARG